MKRLVVKSDGNQHKENNMANIKKFPVFLLSALFINFAWVEAVPVHRKDGPKSGSAYAEAAAVALTEAVASSSSSISGQSNKDNHHRVTIVSTTTQAPKHHPHPSSSHSTTLKPIAEAAVEAAFASAFATTNNQHELKKSTKSTKSPTHKVSSTEKPALKSNSSIASAASKKVAGIDDIVAHLHQKVQEIATELATEEKILKKTKGNIITTTTSKPITITSSIPPATHSPKVTHHVPTKHIVKHHRSPKRTNSSSSSHQDQSSSSTIRPAIVHHHAHQHSSLSSTTSTTTVPKATHKYKKIKIIKRKKKHPVNSTHSSSSKSVAENEVNNQQKGQKENKEQRDSVSVGHQSTLKPILSKVAENSIEHTLETTMVPIVTTTTKSASSPVGSRSSLSELVSATPQSVIAKAFSSSVASSLSPIIEPPPTLAPTKSPPAPVPTVPSASPALAAVAQQPAHLEPAESSPPIGVLAPPAQPTPTVAPVASAVAAVAAVAPQPLQTIPATTPIPALAAVEESPTTLAPQPTAEAASVTTIIVAPSTETPKLEQPSSKPTRETTILPTTSAPSGAPGLTAEMIERLTKERFGSMQMHSKMDEERLQLMQQREISLAHQMRMASRVEANMMRELIDVDLSERLFDSELRRQDDWRRQRRRHPRPQPRTRGQPSQLHTTFFGWRRRR